VLLPFNSSPEKWSEISNFILEFTRINGAGRLSRRAHSGTTRYPGRGRCREIGERGHSWRRSYFDDSVEKPTVTPLSLDTSTLSVVAHTITVTATDSDGTPDTGSASVTLGLLPAALSHYIGSDSQRPFAIVIAGGLIINLAMSIFILPNLYVWFASEGDRLQEAGETFEG